MENEEENEEEICRKFLQNPNINPETGGRLNYGMGPYNRYVELCKKYGLPTLRVSSTRNVIPPQIIKPVILPKVSQSITVPQVSKPVISAKVSRPIIVPKVNKPIMPSKIIQASNKIGLSGLPELDQEIILNSDLESIINLYSTTKSFRQLTEKMLPQIIQKHQETIVNLDLTTILNFYPTNELSRQIIEQLLPQIAQKHGKVGNSFQIFGLHDEIADFAFELLKRRHLKLLKQLLEIFIVTDINVKYDYEYDLYVRLGYDLFISDFVTQAIIEDYFKLAPTDIDWNFLDDVLETPLMNYPPNDIVSMMIATFDAAIAINNVDLMNLMSETFDAAVVIHNYNLIKSIIGIWNLWKDSIREVIETDESNEELKSSLLHLLDNLEAKMAKY